jgi:hypothetical protein
MVGGEGETVGELAQRYGGVDGFGDENVLEFGDHGRPGGGETVR